MAKLSQETQLAVIQTDISYIREEIKSMNHNISSGYVPLPEFRALQDKVDLIYRGLFFLIGIIVLAVFGAIFRLVFK